MSPTSASYSTRSPSYTSTSSTRPLLPFFLNNSCAGSILSITTKSAPGRGREVVLLDLLNCISVVSVLSPTHPSAQDDVGTITARLQSAERGGQLLIDMLVPFHFLAVWRRSGECHRGEFIGEATMGKLSGECLFVVLFVDCSQLPDLGI